MSERPRPQGMTLVLPICDGREGALRAELDHQQKGTASRLRELRGLHQARLEVLKDSEGTPGLLIETLFEGALEAHLSEFHVAAQDALRAIGKECALEDGLENAQAFVELARARSLRAQVFYVAAAHWPLEERGLPWRSILGERLSELLPALALVPWFELNAWLRPSRNVMNSTAALAFDAVGIQTPFTALLALRPGWGRRESLFRALSLVDALLSQEPVFDEAGGVSALQNARFVLLPRERLLVTGVCDGSLAFFFDRLAETVSPFFSSVFMHTEGFPRTRALVFGGARRDAAYLRWRSAFHAPAGIWYSADPELSASKLRKRARDVRSTRVGCALTNGALHAPR